MPLRVEAYTTGGILTGVVSRPGHLREVLEGAPELLVEDASWAPIDGSPPSSGGSREIAIDDLVVAVGDDEQPGPVHAAWHALRLEAGPYVVDGELPTLPGFDPGRALTRPTGSFVLLRDVRISLLGNAGAGENTHEVALVNRYSVDRVDAELMLGFFFPGAHVPAAPAVEPTTVVAEPVEVSTGPGILQPAAPAVAAARRAQTAVVAPNRTRPTEIS
ncbi:MAG TPA: hypothetical protein VKA85_07930 [Candidatus Limnocylindrales bacterium]|nr:hypothetical protein [Candidatus Limnocylindrales bacterium]